MTYEQAKIYVKEQLKSYLESKGIDTRKPFRCLNPEHEDNTPSMSFDPRRNKCKCFGCNVDYDTFDLIAIDCGTKGGETFKRAFDLYRLEIDHDRPYGCRRSEPIRYSPPPQSGSAETNSGDEQNSVQNVTTGFSAATQIRPSPDVKALTAAIDQAHTALMKNEGALAYLQGRGLTLATIKRHKIGYSVGGQNALLQGYNEQFRSRSSKAQLYRYIFPVLDNNGSCCYFISEISDRTRTDDHNGKYMKLRNTSQRFWGESCISYNSGEIFVCEGVYDALSIEQSGGRAIALTGTGGISRISELEGKPGTDNTYIIALDSDAAGQKAAQSLKKALIKAGKACIIMPLDGAKDANELLQRDPAALADYVGRAKAAAAAYKAEFDRTLGIAERLIGEKGETYSAGALTENILDREREAAEYPKLTAAAQLRSFMENIRSSEFQRTFSTGFKSLDRALDGGIYPGGLYFLGAISSLGKTTLALQIADNIAAAGRDVLIFSLEMARDELMAKSVSRHTFTEDMRLYGGCTHAKSTRGILKGSNYRYHTEEEKRVIQAAIESYAKYAEHIYIRVGVGTIGVDEIREAAEKHIRITGNTPVIVIDYLQILAPADPRATDKQNTDTAVLELKRLARDRNTPVIAISSFNRQSYTDPVSMSSFKESGAVEYTSDVLIGLQYMGMDYVDGEGEKERCRRIRELQKTEEEKGRNGEPQSIQVKILKQRNFSKGEVILSFYPRYNYYTESRAAAVECVTAARGTEKYCRQKELDKLTAAFFEVEGSNGSGTAALGALADKLDLKKAVVKARLREYTDLFTVKGETVIYRPEGDTDTE